MQHHHHHQQHLYQQQNNTAVNHHSALEQVQPSEFYYTESRDISGQVISDVTDSNQAATFTNMQHSFIPQQQMTDHLIVHQSAEQPCNQQQQQQQQLNQQYSSSQPEFYYTETSKITPNNNEQCETNNYTYLGGPQDRTSGEMTPVEQRLQQQQPTSSSSSSSSPSCSSAISSVELRSVEKNQVADRSGNIQTVEHHHQHHQQQQLQHQQNSQHEQQYQVNRPQHDRQATSHNNHELSTISTNNIEFQMNNQQTYSYHDDLCQDSWGPMATLNGQSSGGCFAQTMRTDMELDRGFCPDGIDSEVNEHQMMNNAGQVNHQGHTQQSMVFNSTSTDKTNRLAANDFNNNQEFQQRQHQYQHNQSTYHLQESYRHVSQQPNSDVHEQSFISSEYYSDGPCNESAGYRTQQQVNQYNGNSATANYRCSSDQQVRTFTTIVEQSDPDNLPQFLTHQQQHDECLGQNNQVYQANIDGRTHQSHLFRLTAGNDSPDAAIDKLTLDRSNSGESHDYNDTKPLYSTRQLSEIGKNFDQASLDWIAVPRQQGTGDKAKPLKGRRGRPRKKGLRSKSEFVKQTYAIRMNTIYLFF